MRPPAATSHLPMAARPAASWERRAGARLSAAAPVRKGGKRRTLKISLDVLMLGLFLYLMSYHPGGGLLLHAYLGCALFVLFIVHHALNFHWHRTLLKGKYNLRRSLVAGSAVLLLAAMIVTMVSSWHIASMALPFEFLPPPRGTWRDLHVAATAWCFVLMALHLGLHLHNTLSKWERQLKAHAAAKAWALRLLQASVLLGAVWCLQRNQVLSDLLMLPVRPIAFEPLRFYAEHLVIIGGFAVFTHGLLALLTPQRPAR